LGDLLGSLTVMASVFVIKMATGWWTHYVDSLCTLLIVLIISLSAVPLVRQSANMLLGKAPFDAVILSEMDQELVAIRITPAKAVRANWTAPRQRGRIQEEQPQSEAV